MGSYARRKERSRHSNYNFGFREPAVWGPELKQNGHIKHVEQMLTPQFCAHMRADWDMPRQRGAVRTML